MPQDDEQPPALTDAAALADAVRRCMHDLNGIFAPGLLMAERLQLRDDPLSRRAGDVVADMIARAIARLQPLHGMADALSARQNPDIPAQEHD